jgi:ADP-heptose:LPS heptosyltransferase
MKFLIIQTAFIGDVVLSTALAESLAKQKKVEIHYLVRNGNESLLQNNPHIKKVWVWNKQKQKILNLVQLTREIRREKFDVVVNLQRFSSSGFLTCFSGAKKKIGFSQNPWSFCYHFKKSHDMNSNFHEVERNAQLIQEWIGDIAKPRMYPSELDFSRISNYTEKPYVCLAPSSVWYTKQWPMEQFAALTQTLSQQFKVYILGGKGDVSLCESLVQGNVNIENLAGQLNFLESAALMQQAEMNFVNDSGPLHFASAMNAPVTAFFCSTIPAFGFGPLSDKRLIWESKESLTCKPCGLHGKKSCPKMHFKCGVAKKDEIQFLSSWWIS